MFEWFIRRRKDEGDVDVTLKEKPQPLDDSDVYFREAPPTVELGQKEPDLSGKVIKGPNGNRQLVIEADTGDKIGSEPRPETRVGDQATKLTVTLTKK